MSILRRTLLSVALAAATLTALATEAAAGTKAAHGTYWVVILPPDGGPDSFAAGYLIYAALNPFGTVAVAADTSSGGANSYIWTDGRQIDLQPLPQLTNLTGTNTSINWINQWGLVAGYGTRTDSASGQSYDTAALWLPNGTVLPLKTPAASTSRAVWVNDFGQASGWIAPGAVSDPCSFGVGDGLQSQAVIWEFGQVHPLGSLGGTDSYGEFINDLGQISGHAQTSNTVNSNLGCPPFDPFVWQNGKMTDINPGNFGGAEGGTNYLNNHGQAVGFGTLAGEIFSHAFLWSHGKLTDLTSIGSLGAADQQGDTAYNVNEQGHVVGGSTTTEGAFLGVLWRDGELVNLMSLSAEGDDCSQPLRINSHDQIVGVSFSCETGTEHAFVWENGSMADLNALIPADSGIELVYAGWINDAGMIAGQGVLTSGADAGASRAVLLIPTGECRDNAEAASAATPADRQTRNALLHTAGGLINPLILRPFDPQKLFHKESLSLK
jgi:probable HAF family extracellular repeat protein